MRKIKEVTIDDKEHPKNRDNGKKFILEEFAATEIADWIDQFALLSGKSAINVAMAEQSSLSQKMMQIALGSIAILNYHEARPLLDKLLVGVKIQDGDRSDITRLMDPKKDIEEVWTIYKLRYEMIQLHADFFLEGNPWISPLLTQAPTSTNTETSPQKLGQLSRQARQALRKR